MKKDTWMRGKVAVITPYYKEPMHILQQCCESVARQGADVDHFLVADGFPKRESVAAESFDG